MPAAVDITGQTFGRLTALSRVGSLGGAVLWLCDCVCGNRTTCTAKRLRSGNTKSCGCLSSEVIADRNRNASTHGKTNTPTFTAWVNMKQRCTNPKHKSYHRYGGRGITICERWLSSFEAFLEDMGEKPDGAQLDREDNTRGYTPDNCRWVTPEQNSNNREVCRFIEYMGKRQTIAQWAREIGCSRQALRFRIEQEWSPEEALTTPFNKSNRWRNKV